MNISCLRRPPGARDVPGPADRDALEAIGVELRIDDARLAAAVGAERHWIVPTRDGEGVFVLRIDEAGNGTGFGVSFAALAERGASIGTAVRRGAWRHVVLVADGYDDVQIGDVRAAVLDNLVVLDLRARGRLIRLRGPAGERTLDLGPSDWDAFAASSGG